MTILEMQKQMINEALVRHNGNRTRAAKELGMSIRALRNWISGRNKSKNL